MGVKEVAIYGFGRIGSVLSRQIIDGENFRLVAIKSRFSEIGTPAEAASQAAKLLYHNQPYGIFSGHEISFAGNVVIVDGHPVQVEKVDTPDKITWTRTVPPIVFESSGAFKDYNGLHPFFNTEGVRWVVLTSPAKNKESQPKIPTVVIGANEEMLDKIDFSQKQIVSAASCTTTCLAPVAKVLDRSFRINNALFTTIHTMTESQNLLHGTAKDVRVMAPAMNNIIVYKTGASEALTEVLPELAPKFRSVAAYRVPVITGSVLQLEAQVERPVSAEAVNKVFLEASQGRLNGVIKVLQKGTVEDQACSSICIGDPHSALVLESATEVNGDWVKVVAYYDNEWGYCQRVQDLAKEVARRG